MGRAVGGWLVGCILLQQQYVLHDVANKSDCTSVCFG